MKIKNVIAFTIVFCVILSGIAYSQGSSTSLSKEKTLAQSDDFNFKTDLDSDAQTAVITAQNTVSSQDKNEKEASKDMAVSQALITSDTAKNNSTITDDTASKVKAETQTPVSVSKNVTAIEVKGNKSISTTVILSKIKTRVNSEYSTNIISEDIKRLNELGYFSDISIDTQDFEGGLKVIIFVSEKPLISKIVFEGYFSRIIREEKARQTIKLKEGQYLDQVLLKEDINTLKDICVKKGYSQAEVTYKTEADPQTGKVTLKITIDTGKRIRIKKIDIRGNKSFKARRLLKVIKTRKAALFASGFYKEDLLRDDIERLKSFYRREGFADVKVDYETGYEAKKGFMFVAIRIEEGKKYVVGDIIIKDNTVFNNDQIKNALKSTVTNKVYSQEGMRDDISNIQSLYFDKGYIFAEVSDSTYFNTATNKVDITYKIDEGEVAYVDKIKIKGNIKTRDIVIRRELRIFPGDKFDGDKLKRSKERLQNLGFFEEVGYDIEPSATREPNKRDLVVDVKETKTGEFSFGGGYSTVDKLIGFVEIAQKNFDWKNFPYFTGGGQDLRLRAELGTIAKNFELSFTEPWMFDHPISFGFDVYNRFHERETDVGYGYNEKRTGGDLRLGKELSEYVRANMLYRIEEVDISSVSDNASNDLKKEAGSNLISSLQFGLTKDTTDNVYNPSKGYILAGNAELAGGPFGGDKNFAKFTGRASKYISLPKSSVVEFRLRMGLADAYGDSDEVPIYERFYAGGAYTIRGYRERKVGPIDPLSTDPIGGESSLIGNIEYLYPVIDIIKVAVFYDVGNVWDKLDKFATGDFKNGVGFGVRLKTPIGPVRLDYGWPLNKEPGETVRGKGRFHFSLSHGF